jgi:hypothetical protein
MQNMFACSVGRAVMTTDLTGTLDEAYQRLHATGPEFDGWLSNHGPMAAEAMVRRGHAGRVHQWLDGHMRRLEEFPRGTVPIGADWREALGDPRRVADWTDYFRRELAGQRWRAVLGTWWPRLLPGVAAAATHGVIRVGHAARALLEDGDDAVHVTELAHGLAYWAARWQPVPGAATGVGLAAAGGAPVPSAAVALAAVPRIAGQSGGVGERLGRLADLPGWPAALAAPLSRCLPRRSGPGWRAWPTPPPSGTCLTGTVTPSCWCTRRPLRAPSCARCPLWTPSCGRPAWPRRGRRLRR